MTGFISGWAKRIEEQPEEAEATDLGLWASRQQLLARERRKYHDRLAWKWLFATFALFVVSQTPGLWSFIHWTAFLSAIACGVGAFANWNEARAAALAADTWPTDY